MRHRSALSVATPFLILLTASIQCVDCFSIVLMARRGKGGLKKRLDGEDPSSNKIGSLNQGKGQEITGVSLPAPGKLKGWEFGEGVRMACANIDGNFYAVQGECPRCGFDLWKGTVINDDAFEDLPRVACPTCSTTFSLRTGISGPPLKRTGLQGFIGGLAKQATTDNSTKDAKAFMISRDEDGRVFCRDRQE